MDVRMYKDSMFHVPHSLTAPIQTRNFQFARSPTHCRFSHTIDSLLFSIRAPTKCEDERNEEMRGRKRSHRDSTIHTIEPTADVPCESNLRPLLSSTLGTLNSAQSETQTISRSWRTTTAAQLDDQIVLKCRCCVDLPTGE